MSTSEPCFYEEIGVSLDGKVYETACGDEFTADTLPPICAHCHKSIELVPGCRRCGSIEHTTGWHDADASNTPKTPAIEIKAISGRDFINKLLGEKQ